MWCTAVTCSPRISGVAAMAGGDVNQPRAMGNTTESSGRSRATNTGVWPAAGSGGPPEAGVHLKRRNKAPLGFKSFQMVPKATLSCVLTISELSRGAGYLSSWCENAPAWI